MGMCKIPDSLTLYQRKFQFKDPQICPGASKTMVFPEGGHSVVNKSIYLTRMVYPGYVEEAYEWMDTADDTCEETRTPFHRRTVSANRGLTLAPTTSWLFNMAKYHLNLVVVKHFTKALWNFEVLVQLVKFGFPILRFLAPYTEQSVIKIFQIYYAKLYQTTS